jgi:hypothetical protein
MHRTLATSAIAVALFGLAACKGGGGEAIKFVPESATFVAGIDFKGLQASDAWKDNKEQLTKEGGEELGKLDKCNLGLDHWSRVTIAGDGKSESSIVVVVEGDGLGKKDNLECLAKEDDKVTVEDDGKVVKFDGGEMVGYVVNDGMVALSGEKWSDSVKGLVGGEGKNAGDGDLKDVIGRADTGKHVWFAGILPAQASGMAKAFLGADIKDVAGHLDLSSGLDVKVAANTGSSDDATKAKDAIQKQYDENKDQGKQLGLPESVVDGVKIDSDGSAVVVEVSISKDDMKKIEELAKKQFGM